MPAKSNRKRPDALQSALTALFNAEPDADLTLPGLEGPFRFPSGHYYYYDPREGRYYDRQSDLYLPVDFDPHYPPKWR